MYNHEKHVTSLILITGEIKSTMVQRERTSNFILNGKKNNYILKGKKGEESNEWSSCINMS